jgi:hypothetical protein
MHPIRGFAAGAGAQNNSTSNKAQIRLKLNGHALYLQGRRWRYQKIYLTTDVMKNLALILWVCLMGFGCQKQLSVFELTDQTVVSDQIVKQQHVTELKVLQNAYNDLFNQNMSGNTLSQVISNLQATNDRAIMVDRVLRHMLNRSELVIPSDTAMRTDIAAFVDQSYQRFYKRLPSPFERYKLNAYIAGNQAVTPREVWFAFLTSDEYARK